MGDKKIKIKWDKWRYKNGGERMDALRPDGIVDGKTVRVHDTSVAKCHVARYIFAAGILNKAGVRTAIDMPCGLGYGTSILRRSGIDVTGIDISGKAIKYAKDFYPGKYIRANAEEAFACSPVDCVVSFEGIEHVDDPKKLIQNIHKLSNRYMLLSWPDNWGENTSRGGFHKHNINLDIVGELIKGNFKQIPLATNSGFCVFDRRGGIHDETKLSEIKDPCIMIMAEKLS